MTDTEVESERVYTINDFVHWWHEDNGAPIVVGNVASICQHIEAMGYQIYYIVALEKYYGPSAHNAAIVSSTPSFQTQVLKVVNNLVGRSIAVTDEVPLDQIETGVKFSLPPIPYEMISKMDLFFRLVDEKQHSESILLLTFDTSYQDSEGWGVLVPVQENTSTFCDYDPASIASEQGPTVHIVGSAHSHPNMPAYASGTDHKDQADFDGLHITFGWQKSKDNGATQYHVEQQMGGNNFTLSPEEVFCKAPKIEHDVKEIEEWTSKVSKKTSVPHLVSSKGGGGTGGTGWTGQTYSGRPIELTRIKNLPSDAPKLESSIIIGCMQKGENVCPFCSAIIIPPDLKGRRCLACHQYIAIDGENIADIVNLRVEANVYTWDIDTTNGVVTKPIYMWIRKGAVNVFEKVFDPSAGKA